MIFIKVSKKELPAVWKFFSKTLGEYFPQYSEKSVDFLISDYDQKWLRKSVLEGKRQVWAAFVDLETVGYLIATRHYGGMAFANWLAVKKKFRGQGIATKLLKMWQEQALKDGAHKLYLWTTENNLKFYHEFGFEKVGKMPDGYFGSTDYILFKTLRKPEEKNFLKNAGEEAR